MVKQFDDIPKTIQAYVPGKQVTLAHIIAHPDTTLCEKVGVPSVDAIGILTLTPGETAIIAGDIAIKAADTHIGFLDRFSGTVVIYGSVGAVEHALAQVTQDLDTKLGYSVCEVTLS